VTDLPGPPDPDDGCPVCSGPYCRPGTCSGQEGYVWVNGLGWQPRQYARVLAKVYHRTVVWTDVWTAERFGQPTSRSRTADVIGAVGVAEAAANSDRLTRPPVLTPGMISEDEALETYRLASQVEPWPDEPDPEPDL
jgi:hypothetical protein